MIRNLLACLRLTDCGLQEQIVHDIRHVHNRFDGVGHKQNIDFAKVTGS